MYCTHVLLNHATNDIRNTAGINLATMQGYIRVIWKFFKLKGLKVYQATATSQSSSSDSFVTLTNQTAQYHSLITAWNQFLKAGGEQYLVGVVLAGETVANGDGKWNVRGSSPFAITADGVHPKAMR